MNRLVELRTTQHLSANRRKFPKVVGTTAVVLLTCLPLFSQGNAGRILGSITDQTGGVMANTTVTVTDTERGVARTLTTDEA
jgi:TctA family transporter